jgi:hypothetical protein
VRRVSDTAAPRETPPNATHARLKSLRLRRNLVILEQAWEVHHCRRIPSVQTGRAGSVWWQRNPRDRLVDRVPRDRLGGAPAMGWMKRTSNLVWTIPMDGRTD